jgi:hypothetical protein
METQFRAELDFDISFSSGGSLHGEAFRIDMRAPTPARRSWARRWSVTWGC